MIRRLVPLVVLLLSLSAAALSIEIKHLELNSAHLVQTSAQNYGITSPIFGQNVWKTVSVNGDEVTIWTPTCQTSVRSLQTLNEKERSLLEQVRGQVSSVDGQNFQPNGGSIYSSTSFSQNGSSRRSSSSTHSSMLQLNGISISKSDDQNFSFSKQGLPNNIERVFVINGDIVAFAHSDGRVEMKPIICASADEQQLLEQSRQIVREAEEQSRQNMQKFHQNMQQFQHNMQQGMANMNHNLNNMFSGVPLMNQWMPNQLYNQQPAFGQQFQQQQVPYYSNGANSYQVPPSSPFGNNFPFGPNNSPFGNNFPFGPNNSPFGAGFPFNN